ncbi:MAG: disulfide bond formation protein B [Actinomycetes bacterium]
MPVDTVLTFFALLAVACLVFVVSTVVLFAVSRVRGGLPESLVPLRDGFTEIALPLATAVALTSTLGSLYLSSVAKFVPCELCWFQRFCMYPSTVVLLAAWLTKKVRWWAFVLPAAGLAISTYHYLLERFPDSVAKVCPKDGPDCSVTLIWKFHFLSIPGMAWAGFAAILTLLALAAAGQRRTARTVPPVGTTDDVPQELIR